MKKKVLSLLLAGAMAFSLAACSGNTDQNDTPAPSGTAAASDLDYIKEKGTLVVGVTDYPPLDSKDESGEWVGFDADLCRKVAEAMGVECQFVEIEWNNKLMELENKSIDVIWNGMTLTDEVRNGSSYTFGYLNNGQSLVLSSEAAEQFRSGEIALQDLTPALESGSAGEAAALAAGLTYTAVTSQTDALMEVAAGTSDSCIIDKLLAAVTTGEGTDYADLEAVDQIAEEMDVAACRKGSDLTDFINEQLTALYDDGTILQLAGQYNMTDLVCQPQAADAQ